MTFHRPWKPRLSRLVPWRGLPPHQFLPKNGRGDTPKSKMIENGNLNWQVMITMNIDEASQISGCFPCFPRSVQCHLLQVGQMIHWPEQPAIVTGTQRLGRRIPGASEVPSQQSFAADLMGMSFHQEKMVSKLQVISCFTYFFMKSDENWQVWKAFFIVLAQVVNFAAGEAVGQLGGPVPMETPWPEMVIDDVLQLQTPIDDLWGFILPKSTQYLGDTWGL